MCLMAYAFVKHPHYVPYAKFLLSGIEEMLCRRLITMSACRTQRRFPGMIKSVYMDLGMNCTCRQASLAKRSSAGYVTKY